jgi:hypothetical protein
VHDAGTRIDPPPSAACASGAIPAATATAAPPEEPPGERSVSHGLRVTPSASLSVKLIVPNSEVVVFPSSTNPASANRRTTGSESVGRAWPAPADPYVVGQPATSYRSLIGSGTPWKGGRSAGDAAAISASVATVAALRTSSSARKQKALRRPSSSFIRSR